MEPESVNWPLWVVVIAIVAVIGGMKITNSREIANATLPDSKTFCMEYVWSASYRVSSQERAHVKRSASHVVRNVSSWDVNRTTYWFTSTNGTRQMIHIAVPAQTVIIREIPNGTDC